MIKAVLFDLDGTLYDRDRLAAALFAQQYALFAHELAGISEDRFMRDVLAMDGHGHGSKELGYSALAESWGADSVLAARLFAHFRETYDRHCHLSDDTRETLDALRARGLKLGVRKPDAEIFRRALARLEVAAREALFVGDHPVADVEGAHRAGARCVEVRAVLAARSAHCAYGSRYLGSPATAVRRWAAPAETEARRGFRHSGSIQSVGSNLRSKILELGSTSEGELRCWRRQF